MLSFLKYFFGSAQDRKLYQYKKKVSQINEAYEKFKSLSESEFKAKTESFKKRYQEDETLEELLPEAYGLVKAACQKLCGQTFTLMGHERTWNMVPFDVQLLGAIAMHHTSIAEMQTGEGKTLTATLPLYLNALSGKPVHLVTVNDYLAERDCEWNRILFEFLGISCGYITQAVSPFERKDIYQRDIVYGTASEFGFDYLRDNSLVSSKDEQVQRGHFFAMVDEIDSILIDEARTPLIISGPSNVSKHLYDELKDGVAGLVKAQQALCNRLATEAWKTLNKLKLTDPAVDNYAKKLSSDEEKELEKAILDLWLVSKGTPCHKTIRRSKENPFLRDKLDQQDLYFYSDPNKKERLEVLAELYILIDEKSSDYELTDKGIALWADVSGASKDDPMQAFTMLDLGGEYALVDENSSLSAEEKMEAKLKLQEEDSQRKERAHNLRQLLRAHLLMERDVEYIIQDKKIIIIDEHTGRPQPGRRYSDGLHQAIEAKEGVPIQKETQTYATVTLQNYFRMYERLSGMSGTAITEAMEFKEIYNLEVLQIPTHLKCIRVDFEDEVYMTEREKYAAMLNDIKEAHEQGRPLLIGTESVEASEKLSRILKQHRLTHTVLNAKHHAQEAEIVAQAGQKAAITISTNMAGRGTDIRLGEGVAKAGGLYVMGATRHHSRRIDRQLRGRCSRQGDPGSSKFYVSFEDQLIRLFASPKMAQLLQRFRPPEGEPISSRMLTKSIETAQKRIEQRNYTIRKHTLEYDDVMNVQRKEIYAYRNDLLHHEEPIEFAKDLLSYIPGMLIEQLALPNNPEPEQIEELRELLLTHLPITFEEQVLEEKAKDLTELENYLSKKLEDAFREKLETERSKLQSGDERSPVLENTIRNIMIKRCDHIWQDHLLTMDHLRSEVHMHALAQKDPLMEFKEQAFELFSKLTHDLRLETALDLFKFQLIAVPQEQIEQLLAQLKLETERSLVDEVEETIPPDNR